MNALTQEGIPAASVTVLNSAGTPTGAGTVADSSGQFAINSTTLDQGGSLAISSVGYQTITVNPNIIIANGQVGLMPSTQDLTTVTVTAKKNNLPTYLLGGGVGLFLLASMGHKKKRAMGSVTGDVAPIVLVGGGLALLYFGIIKPILKETGLINSGPSAQAQATEDQQAAGLAQAKKDAAAQGQTGQTYPDTQFTSWANDIFTLGTKSTVDQSAIVWDVINVNTQVDMMALIKAFGVRRGGGILCEIGNSWCTEYDLNSFLKETLDADHIAEINQYLSQQGINYVF